MKLNMDKFNHLKYLEKKKKKKKKKKKRFKTRHLKILDQIENVQAISQRTISPTNQAIFFF